MTQRAIVSVQWRQSPPPPPPCNLLADQKRGICWQHIWMMAINLIIKLTALSRYTFVDKLNYFRLSATSSQQPTWKYTDNDTSQHHTHLFSFLFAFDCDSAESLIFCLLLSAPDGEDETKFSIPSIGEEARRPTKWHVINFHVSHNWDLDAVAIDVTPSTHSLFLSPVAVEKEKQQLWCTLTYYSVRGLNLK